MVFKDEKCMLYQNLRLKWHNTPEAPLEWCNFIEWMDLGVSVYTVGDSNSFTYYKIVDNKKWIFTRLKYGF